MNSKILMGIVGVIVIGLGAWFLMSGNSGTESSEDSASPAAAMKSLGDLLGMNQNLKCTFTSKVEVAESKGTVYVSGGKMRGDFTSVVLVSGAANQTVESHMIATGDTNWVWSSDQPQGFKMSMGDFTKQNEEVAGQTGQNPVPVGWADKTEYHCEPWNPDASYFEIPKNIEFIDPMEMMKSLPGGMSLPGGSNPSGASNAEACKNCDLIPDADAKAQCRQVLGCK